MKLLSAQEILLAQDLQHEDVQVPEWGGVVRLQALTGAQRDAWEMDMFGADASARNMKNARAKLIARCAVGSDGKPLFTSKDIDSLGNKSAAALDRLFTVAKRINRIGAEDVNELVGNSKTSPTDDSTSV